MPIVPKLTFEGLVIGDLFVAIKVIPCDVRGERVADNAVIWRKISPLRAVQLMSFDPFVWSATDTLFDPNYRIIRIIPG